MPPHPRPVVFDLDQTLILGGALDWRLWLEAVSGALGVRIDDDEDWAALPVHTDHGLLEALSWRHRGRGFSELERARYEAGFLASLDAALAAEPMAFPTLPGADAAVGALRHRAVLATGNLHQATQRKLRHSGLDRHRLPCSCSEGARDRTHLVARALSLLGWEPGQPATSLGDGAWDVRAARALGIGFIGVAETEVHEARLRQAGARHIIRDYADLDAVLALVETAEPPAP